MEQKQLSKEFLNDGWGLLGLNNFLKSYKSCTIKGHSWPWC